MTRRQVWLIVAGVLGLIALVCVGAFAVNTFLLRATPTEVATNVKPIVSIKSPLPGAILPPNEDVLVQIVAADTLGVIRVELWVNSVLVSSESSPIAEGLKNFTSILKWKPTAPGSYNLEARAINRSNLTSDPAFVVVTVQAGATPLPSPTNTSTPTSAPNVTNTPIPPTATFTAAPPTATRTPTALATATRTATAAATATRTRTPTPTNTPIPFLVTSVTASVLPVSSSTCPTTFNFSATINANGPGTVTYVWERSDSASAPTQSIAFSGAGSQTVATSWTISASYGGWERVRIITPNALVSNQANFTLVCTYSTGALDIPQTFSADLDAGTVTSNANSDIWFEAVTATERYVTPRNGSKIAIHGTSAPSFFDCQSEALSTNRININSLPVGTYVCVLTSAARYAEFRVNAPAVGPSPGTLHIGFTTWR